MTEVDLMGGASAAVPHVALHRLAWEGAGGEEVQGGTRGARGAGASPPSGPYWPRPSLPAAVVATLPAELGVGLLLREWAWSGPAREVDCW